ncbi:winged helix-turn-helix domain-containing protein [Streptomyces sp. NPDC088748]|uniref:winged helix-turn-helix domain-containing protein n=1 Tax=Streptomyces sp. NPDC088748 TaxID=3365887 RepID=UPI003808975F
MRLRAPVLMPIPGMVLGAGRRPGRDRPGRDGKRSPSPWFRGRPVDPGASRRRRGACDGSAAVEGLGWRLLTGRLGWSLQRPERRAVERDESEIARWIAHEWPRIKKGP